MYDYGEVLENVDLKKYNTYKIGGIAKYIVKPYNIECLINLINYLKVNNIKYFVLGRGSNVILPDEDYNGVIILLDNLKKIEIKDNIVVSEAGINLSELINNVINNNLGGLENLLGIPGTLGGGIIGNVGCYGSVISDNLISVTYLQNGEIKTINKDECNFSYRNSLFKENKDMIVLSAKFLLKNSNKDEMLKKVKENMIKRNTSQPLEFPNAGSVFRNPENVAAGKLIEDLGLKNYNVNDAYISEKHANFIINKGNAKSEDIKELIRIVKDKVKEEYGIELILEQEIVQY